jgi:hypothetical protein
VDNLASTMASQCLVEMKLPLHCMEVVAAETFRFSKGVSVLAHDTCCGYYGEGDEQSYQEHGDREYCHHSA